MTTKCPRLSKLNTLSNYQSLWATGPTPKTGPQSTRADFRRKTEVMTWDQ